MENRLNIHFLNGIFNVTKFINQKYYINNINIIDHILLVFGIIFSFI